jgi:hypothetical protein
VVSLRADGDAELSRNPDGSLRAVAGTTLVAASEQAVMWDSSGAPAGRRPGPQNRAAAEPSTPAGPGDGARQAAVTTRVTGDGHLELRPDRALLDAPDVRYPIYVDPAWSVAKTRWAYATNNGCTNTDYAVARVGLSPEGPCVGSLYRSFFEFATTSGKVSLKGKHIRSAYVQMVLDHSFACINAWTHMYHSGAINATMKASWSIRLSQRLVAAEGHANEGNGCSDSPQDDMVMNFTGSAVTTKIQEAATKNWNAITLGFCACNQNGDYEREKDRWMKYFPNRAKLVVDYDSKPGKPGALQVAGVACPTSGVMTTGTLSPTFSAVYPDADTGQTLTGTYEWIEVPAGGIGSVTATSPARKPRPPLASATANGRARTGPVTVVKGKTYAYRVTTEDPYGQWSGWSAWCQFTADTSVPPVTATVVSPPTGPGQPVTFRLESTAVDVASFKYGWTGPTTARPAAGSNPKSLTVTLTAPAYGLNILYVSAIDATQNEGFGSVELTVPRPSPAKAIWGLEVYPGQTEPQAWEDKQPAVGGDTPVTPTNVTWTPDTRMVDGQAATFDGAGSSLTTAGPVIDTTKSFSVAAWVRLGATPTADSKIITQDGADAAGFELGVRRQGSPLLPYWSFAMKDTAAQSSATRAAVAPAPISATDVGQWVHLAGVYDQTAAVLRLYVNGSLVNEAARIAAPWTATGRFVIGRGFGPASGTNWWRGSAADVRVFDRVLVTHDFTGKLADEETVTEIDEPGVFEPLRVGRWAFEVASSCYFTDRADSCEARDVTPFDRRLALSRGAAVGHGQNGSALHLDGTYFPDESAEPWETTQEWGRTAVKAGVTAPDGNGHQSTVWQDRPVLRTEQPFTVSAWALLEDGTTDQTVVAQSGNLQSAFRISYRATDQKWLFTLTDEDTAATAQAQIVTAEPVSPDVWSHLVGVYDPGRQQGRLYVDGALAGTASVTWKPVTSTGPLQVGRALRGGVQGEYLRGRVDDLSAYQGAMTDAQVRTLHGSEVIEAEES